MKKKSVIRTITILMQVQMVTVLLLVVASTVITFRSSLERMDSVSQNFLDIYARQMENRVEKMDQMLSVLVYNNTDLLLLEGEDERESFYASIRLKETLENVIKINDSAQMAVIAQADHGVCLDANNSQMQIEHKNNIRDFVIECADQGTVKNSWEISRIGDDIYLYRMLGQNRKVVAVFLSVDSLLATIPDARMERCNFVLADESDTIWGYSGYPLFDEKTGISVEELQTKWVLCNEESMVNGQFRLYSFEKYMEILRQLQVGGLLLIGAVLLLLAFDVYVLKVLKRRLIMPMNGMTDVMQEIMGGNHELRIVEYGDNKEFSFLSETFNRLMDEILHLRISFYEKQLELSDAEQKYIHMQIRPHFFLNAMTTLASLSSQGKKDEVNTYVGALSKNIRYMFSSGLHTVALKEEVWHVENYFEMQELKYPDAVFYNVEMPQELEEWRIPQMILHTLVENEYKYAITPDDSLTILIKLSLAELNGEEMLLMEMEDDGKGYPEEVITSINGGKAPGVKDGTHVGLWSIKRLLELMYDRQHLFEVSNVKPHGAMNRIYIPKETVNERSTENMGESGIR